MSDEQQKPTQQPTQEQPTPPVESEGAKAPAHGETPAGQSEGSAREALPTEGQADRAVEHATDRAQGKTDD